MTKLQYIILTLTLTSFALAEDSLSAGVNTKERVGIPTATGAIDPALKQVQQQESTGTGTGIANTSYRWNGFTISATVVAAGVVAAGLFGVFSMFFPLLAYKVCYLVGGCQNTLADYVDNYVANNGKDVYPRSRRSMDYMGPLLETLALAYERFGADDIDSDGVKKTSPESRMSQHHYGG